ncbi:MAG: glycine cleavage T C-terminal barrel domain-containing protein [Acidimicrobiales bacterium]
MAGLSQGGGVGLATANWMTTNDPGFDVWGMDNARFGDWATPRYTNPKVTENYARRFRISFPNEELPAARNHMTSPIHDRLAANNAVFGAAFGLEYPLWFQREGEAPVETVTFRRSNAFAVVANEVAAVRSGVGMLETTGYAKYQFRGPGARSFLDSILTNTLPKVGRLALTSMLNHQGKIIGDFTVAALADDDFMVFGSGPAERYHERWFRAQLPTDRSVQFDICGNELTGLSLAGPLSRDVLADLCDIDLSTDAFPFRQITRTWVGAVPVILSRVSFTGDLGYEIWCKASYQQQLFDSLMAAGAPHGLRLFGIRALDSMRLDKLWGSWSSEYRPIYDPIEANLGWMVKASKSFIGSDAVAAVRAAGPTRKLVAFSVDVGSGPDAADCYGDEPIAHNGKVIGWVTSGGFAHHSGLSIALGYVPIELATEADGWEIEIVGEVRPAALLTEAPFDPSGQRLRA